MAKITIKQGNPNKICIEVETDDDAVGNALNQMAVNTVVTLANLDVGPFKSMLKDSREDFFAGVIAGLYATGRSEKELIPIFSLLFTISDIAKHGLERPKTSDDGEEEYRIIEER